jgi:hypothetical protein
MRSYQECKRSRADTQHTMEPYLQNPRQLLSYLST